MRRRFSAVLVGPSSGITIGAKKKETSKFFLYFSGGCIPTNESLFILLALCTLAQTFQDYAVITCDAGVLF